MSVAPTPMMGSAKSFSQQLGPPIGVQISPYGAKVERFYNCACGKPAKAEFLVEKVEKVGKKHYRTGRPRLALVCPECGPIAWER